jgi:hypothetical protein
MTEKFSTVVGDDSENAWNDRHLQHAYLWLTTNPNSPYVGSPAMLFTAMGISKPVWMDFRKAFNRANFSRYRYIVRIRMTKALQKVLAGEYIPTVTKRNKRNQIIGYTITPAVNPQPLNCPPFYRGSVKLTTKGLQISLRRTDAQLAPKHDPEGRNRLINAFQKR